MTHRYFERESSHTGNYIPIGRQLPRTPPLPDVKRHLDFCNEDSEVKASVQVGSRVQDENEPNGIFDLTLETKTEPDEQNSMLKGMKGYQLTAGDQEFIEKMKEEKFAKKLQGDLEEMQKQLKKKMMLFELTCGSREKAQAVLRKFPSCEHLTEWMKKTLGMTSPLTEVTQKKRMAVNKKKEEAKERGQLEKQTNDQLKIQGLMSQLTTMKSQLTQQEEIIKTLKMQISNNEAPETKVEAEGAKTSEQPQAANAKSQGKERKKVQFSEKLQKSTNQSKLARNEVADGKTESNGRKRGRNQAAEAEEDLGPRRSKRIASRR